jgi:hypothetical protein
LYHGCGGIVLERAPWQIDRKGLKPIVANQFFDLAKPGNLSFILLIKSLHQN